MKPRALVQKTFLAMLLFLFLSPVAKAQGVGAIGGTVQDVSGAVIPGVTVILSNPGTIGGNQQVVSDERGLYQFSRLVPSSTYSVKAELGGFRAVVRSSVVVTADSVARVDLTLEVGEVSDTVTVTGQMPLLDTTSVYKQTVLDRQTPEVLPTGRDIW